MKKACEVCGLTEDLVVDHDHESGKVRGTLCGFCNRGSGSLCDNPKLVRNLLHYLERPIPDDAPTYKELNVSLNWNKASRPLRRAALERMKEYGNTRKRD
jgi:hypothetical protein